MKHSPDAQLIRMQKQDKFQVILAGFQLSKVTEDVTSLTQADSRESKMELNYSMDSIGSMITARTTMTINADSKSHYMHDLVFQE